MDTQMWLISLQEYITANIAHAVGFNTAAGRVNAVAQNFQLLPTYFDRAKTPALMYNNRLYVRPQYVEELDRPFHYYPDVPAAFMMSDGDDTWPVAAIYYSDVRIRDIRRAVALWQSGVDYFWPRDATNLLYLSPPVAATLTSGYDAVLAELVAATNGS